VTRTRYRLTSLHIPTLAEARGGALAGADLDGVDDACGEDDYPGSVDNALVGLAAGLPALTPDDPQEMQGSIDAGLFCDASSEGCAGVAFDVHVLRCGRTARVELLAVEGGDETVLGFDDPVRLDDSGQLGAHFERLVLEVPTDHGDYQSSLTFALTNAVLTGTVQAEGIEDIVIAGVVHRADFFAAFLASICQTFFPDGAVACTPDQFDFPLYDVITDPDEGECDGLSIGFTAAADALTP